MNKKRSLVHRILHCLNREWKYLLWHFAAYFPLFPSYMLHYIRPWIWKKIGVNIQKGCGIGFGVYLDVDGSSRLFIGKNVRITSECLFILHHRDNDKYRKGMLQKELPYVQKNIIIGDNVTFGMRALIMPGVTIGEGAIIGAGSVVTKDIPPYCVAVGNPAKVIRHIE